MEENNNTTIAQNIPPEFTSTCDISDEDIRLYCTYVKQHCSDEKSERLYTEEQMLRMFKEGYREGCKYRKNKKRRSNGVSPYSLIRSMDVGDIIDFPVSLWGAVRVSASILKRDFNCVFRTNKIKLDSGDSIIQIERTL